MPPGKLDAGLLADLLAKARAGAHEVLLGPSIGEDAAAIAVPQGTLVVATDPITFTGHGLGRYAVVINANDVAVTGARPRWFLCTLLLPPGTNEAAVRVVFDEINKELRELGASLVGGHTEVTPAVNQPVAVGQFIGHTADGRFVRTGGMSPGDVLVQVNPAPVEGAGVLATECRERLSGLPAAMLERAAAGPLDPGISVVAPALRAANLGAVSLHDPTEGGLATALWEVAESSGVALEIDGSSIIWFEPGLAVCRELGADPWGTLASGTLLAAFAPANCEPAIEALGDDGWLAARIGQAAPGSGVQTLEGKPLPRFEPDEVARILAGN